MFEKRDNEPAYALLLDTETADVNCYGSPIKLAPGAGVSLKINGDSGVGANPNRTKQHGFHFTADNCIGCHACEAACSEKNDLPPHLSFRSVGYVEGGSYPNYTRINISMACNHCDDPVCLKGCPTRAYTKHPEYGAVIQDPDICFGCGYCTWVCPYNAPQLDPLAGQVEKCNMCVDRLEVGLKPACVSACLGNALDFGVIENTPENRDQKKIRIPGFPDPEITRPNIRFQQKKSIPRTFSRPDSMPIKYHRQDDEFGSVLNESASGERRWNLKRLSSRENPLVLFTLATQAAIGAFALSFLGGEAGWGDMAVLTSSTANLVLIFVLLCLQGLVLGLSTSHLGKPLRFYRGFNNLRHSPLSREALGIAVFFACLGLYFVCLVLARGILPLAAPDFALMGARIFGWLAVTSGSLGIYLICAVYFIKARPFWNHWQTVTAFAGTAMCLGAVLAGMAGLPLFAMRGTASTGFGAGLAGILALGILVEAVGHWFHARDLNHKGGEGAASRHIQATAFGKTYVARNILLAANLTAATALALSFPGGWAGVAVWSLIAVSVLLSSLAGRALFYVAVVPTTMPGAFFWKNKGFEEHARKTGLARMPQVGVVPETH